MRGDAASASAAPVSAAFSGLLLLYPEIGDAAFGLLPEEEDPILHIGISPTSPS
jgi:hypothetical protein